MYVGEGLARNEDVRFLLGRGSYVDDVSLPAAPRASRLST